MESSSNGFRKGAWTAEEDSLLRQCIEKYGEEKWHRVPLRAGLNRCRKSCRLRWVNYLKPGLNREKFSSDEVDLLLRLHKLLGNRWSLIAGRLPGRTANDVKNYWNTNMGKKQENCCESKMRKRDMTSLATTSAGLLEVGLGEVSTNDGSIKCNKDEEKFEFVNNLMDGETMWRKSLLEESQEANVVCPPVSTTDEADNSLINSMSSTFDDVDQLCNLFDANI